jgi:hypothetical protein
MYLTYVFNKSPFLWALLRELRHTARYDKIDQIAHINLAYKVLFMLFTSHCDCYRSVDVGTSKMTLDGLLCNRIMLVSISQQGIRERINKLRIFISNIEMKFKSYTVCVRV